MDVRFFERDLMFKKINYKLLLGVALFLSVFSKVSAIPSSDYLMPDAFSRNSSYFISQDPVPRLNFRSKKILSKKQSSLSQGSSTERELLDYFSSIGGRLGKKAWQGVKGVKRQNNVSDITKEQRQAFYSLRQATSQGNVVAEFDKRNGTVTFLQGEFDQALPLRKSPKIAFDAEYIAKNFLAENKSLFKLQSPETEMEVLEQQTDDLGYQHIKFQQMYQGIPVFAKQLSVHVNTSGAPYLMSGRYIPSFKSIDPIPSISLEQAKEKLREYFSPSLIRLLSDKLVIYTKNNKPHLAYQIEVRKSLLEYWDYFVDAHTGEILHYLNKIQTAATTATGIDELGVTQSFSVWQDNNAYMMIDTLSMGDKNQPFDNEGGIIRGNIYVFDAKNTKDNPETDKVNETRFYYVLNTVLNNGWDAAAVSAISNSQAIFNYYKTRFNRDSVDNKKFPLVSVIHVGKNFANAFWNGWSMNYGDGDNQSFSSLSRCLDVAAHEMTHGLTQHTAGLIYEYQSGALNESFSDVFAAMIDDDDWLVGEDCTLATPGYLRDLETPANGLSSQPAKMSEYRNLAIDNDNGGVHVNSGIPNHAAYLTAGAIGRKKTEAIYYRALTLYLNRSSQFIDARRSLIRSAVDLYGETSSEVSAVKNAWDSVEVVEGGNTDTKPESTDPTDGKDKMYYLYQDDRQGGAYLLFAQSLVKNKAYDEAKDKLLSAQPAANVRPAPYTNKDGTSVFFVDANHFIRAVSPSGELSNPIGDGKTSTISISPDGRYFAFTTIDISDNYIHVLDLENDTAKSYQIEIPSYENSEQVGSVMPRFADSLSFDYASKKIIFDMMVCTPSVESSCNINDIKSGINYWTIGLLDLSFDKPRFSLPFPKQSTGVNLGFPTFANNNNYIIALDVENANGVTTTIVDFEKQVSHNIMTSSQYTVPSFWGDDNMLTALSPSGENKFKAISIPIDNKTWKKASGSAFVVNPFSVSAPIMHRTGERVLISKIEASTKNLNFGDINIGKSKTMTFVVRNKGNHDVNISDISISGDDAVFNLVQGTNTLLPRGAEIKIGVMFKPSSSEGTFIASLNIETNSEAHLQVSLKGNATKAKKRPAEEQGGKNSGGGAINSVMLLFAILFFIVVSSRKRRSKNNETV